MKDDSVETMVWQFKSPLFSESAAILKAGVDCGYWSVMKNEDFTSLVLTASKNFENAEPIIRTFVDRGLAVPAGKNQTGSDKYAPTKKARDVVAQL